MSNEKKQTAVDLFHDKVNDLIKGKKTITSNDIGQVWLECKELEKETIMQAYSDGLGNGIAVGQGDCSFESVCDENKYYKRNWDLDTVTEQLILEETYRKTNER